LQLETTDRDDASVADLAIKAFELSQSLTKKWLKADYHAKRTENRTPSAYSYHCKETLVCGINSSIAMTKSSIGVLSPRFDEKRSPSTNRSKGFLIVETGVAASRENSNGQTSINCSTAKDQVSLT